MAKRPSPLRTEWKLAELAEAAGVSPRTVRYYVQRGLLPAPAFRGPDTVYDAAHLQRLRAIRRLQDAFLPLDAIQAELERAGEQELERLAAGDGVTLAMRRDEIEPPSWTRWSRWELAPGLELHLAEGAAPAARELAERLRRAASDSSSTGKKED